MSGLSDALKQRRSELGCTLAQVADMVGVTAASEAAGLPPMIGDVRKIGRAAALRVETYKMHQRVRDHAAERMQAEPEKFTAAFRADMDTCLRGFDVIFAKKTNAAFWIERENFTAKKWIQLAREIGKSAE